MMDTRLPVLCLFLGGAFTAAVLLTSVRGSPVVVKATYTNCPADYRRRVETCIMEAQLAPQGGGGVSLILNKDKIADLCDRGLLMKTIACLSEIRDRCAENDTAVHDLDRLYSVTNWQVATELLCQDTLLFQTNFECLSRSVSSVMTCILMRTQTFRMLMAFTSPDNHAKRREVTCNYAEGIVKCLRGPLLNQCSKVLGKRISETMFLLLPPFCMADNYITYTPHPTTTSSPPSTPSPPPPPSSSSSSPSSVSTFASVFSTSLNPSSSSSSSSPESAVVSSEFVSSSSSSAAASSFSSSSPSSSFSSAGSSSFSSSPSSSFSSASSSFSSSSFSSSSPSSMPSSEPESVSASMSDETTVEP